MATPERYVPFTGFASLHVGIIVLVVAAVAMALVVLLVLVPGDGRMVLKLRPSAEWV